MGLAAASLPLLLSFCCWQALEKYNIEKDIAAYVKKEFDKKYTPTWHCIVGPQLRLLRYTRDKALHLFLPWYAPIPFLTELAVAVSPLVALLLPSLLCHHLTFAPYCSPGQVAILLFKSG